MKKLVVCLVLLTILTGCQQRLSVVRTPLEDEGEVYVYLKPMPQEADKLRFTLEEVNAVKDDGTETPLTVHIGELKGSEIKGQRLLLSGRLRPGQYTGFSIRAGKAFMAGEDGESSMLVPEKAVKSELQFTITKKKATFISAVFDYKASVKSSFSFTPSFTMLIPEKIVTNLVGYVTNYGADNITVFDKFSRQAVNVIATGRGPLGMAIDQTARKAYLAASGDDEIELIDITAGEVVNRFRLNTGDDPQEVGLTPDGRLLLVTNKGSGALSFIDSSALVEVGRVKVDDGPGPLLIDRAGLRAYVLNQTSNSVSVVDIPTRGVVGSIPTEGSPLRAQFNVAGDRLYVVEKGSPYLTVYGVPSLSVINRVYVGTGMLSVKVDSKTDLIYISKTDEGRLLIYDPFSLVPIDYITTEGDASYMSIDDENNNIFLVIPEKKAVQAANINSRKALSEMDVLDDPYFVTMMGERF
jgi:YVTN family beta-propeller protein